MSLLKKITCSERLRTYNKVIKYFWFSDMHPNYSREGRDPEELGLCPNFDQIYFWRLPLIFSIYLCTSAIINKIQQGRHYRAYRAYITCITRFMNPSQVTAAILAVILFQKITNLLHPDRSNPFQTLPSHDSVCSWDSWVLSLQNLQFRSVDLLLLPYSAVW